MTYVWLGVIVAMVIVEICTTQLVSIWFAVGAFGAFISAIAGVDELWIQIIVFVAVSAIALAATRPVVRKIIKRKAVPTNADRAIGQTGTVIDKIDNSAETGLVKVDGSVWTARSEDGSVIENGQIVTVCEIRGVKLIVKSE